MICNVRALEHFDRPQTVFPRDPRQWCATLKHLDENITRENGMTEGQADEARTHPVVMRDVGIKDEGRKDFILHLTTIECQVLQAGQPGYKTHKAASQDRNRLQSKFL